MTIDLALSEFEELWAQTKIPLERASAPPKGGRGIAEWETLFKTP